MLCLELIASRAVEKGVLPALAALMATFLSDWDDLREQFESPPALPTLALFLASVDLDSLKNPQTLR